MGQLGPALGHGDPLTTVGHFPSPVNDERSGGTRDRPDWPSWRRNHRSKCGHWLGHLGTWKNGQQTIMDALVNGI